MPTKAHNLKTGKTDTIHTTVVPRFIVFQGVGENKR